MRSWLKNKKILITAGPTWIALDKIRVISNISSGSTGIAIAQEAKRQGAKVTLLLGPAEAVAGRRSPVAGLRIVRFKYFEELQRLLKAELKRKYDIIIHAAAVSDYRPVKVSTGKIRSGAKSLKISLRQTPKLLDRIREKSKQAFVVMFKLETGKSEIGLINAAYKAMLVSGADMVVANNAECVWGHRRKAYIISSDKSAVMARTNPGLAKRLLGEIEKRYNNAKTFDRRR